LLLIARSDRLWNDQLTAISPLAKGSGELDARLRSDTGLGDLRFVVAVEGATLDEAIARTEALHDKLRALQSQGAIAGFDSPASLLPSAATQQSRRAALPDAATLRARLTQALAESALRAEGFEPFIADVQRAQQLTITPSYYAGTALGQRLQAQVVDRTQGTTSGATALITLSAVSDASAVATALQNFDGVSLIDLTNVQALVADYRARAVWAGLAGAILIVLILAVQLRNLKATLRIAATVAVSIVITAAVLISIEGGLTLFHLVALLLAAGISTNYALFIGMPRDDRLGELPADALPVTLSVTLAAGTTLIAFSTLALSSTPVLHMIGITVAIGATVALVVSMALAAERPRASTSIAA
jgi:predicted exporter